MVERKSSFVAAGKRWDSSSPRRGGESSPSKDSSSLSVMETFRELLEVRRDVSREEELIEQARGYVEGDRSSGIHASDILYPRKAYWRVVSPKPLRPAEILLFQIGKILHAFVLHQGDNLNISDSGEKYHPELKIFYSPDAVKDGHPVELKSSRGWYIPRERGDGLVFPSPVFDAYFAQLLVYMAAEGVSIGELWVEFLSVKDEKTGRTFPQFRCYRVAFWGDLSQVREWVISTREKIERAVEMKTDEHLPVCPQYLCNDSCAWWKECSAGERRRYAKAHQG